ncbi:hypothetical protein DJ021_07540 [Phenylobacterium hankyongense]|uniref:Uncharacterized protein n=1 Tax=Phenylobacterium hankyongense TaxID=1813876 RepID=A0A328AZE2_9CAUL|nr:hypothetical protein DJ021_07540 [Phenylobacterium hankyongense]
MLILSSAAVALAVAGCEKPKPRPGQPGQATPAATAPAGPASERPGPARWNAQTGAFELNGKPVKTIKQWTFDNATDGFTMGGGVLGLEPGGGLHVTDQRFDPMVLSPKGLQVNGARNPIVLVRLTRRKAGGLWSGVLYYATTQHGTAEQFIGLPLDRKDPAVNETVTLVYNMAKPAAGGDDWTNSTIDQLRFDPDDQLGGEFVIHQVAIGENPDPAAPLGPPAPAPAPTPAH